MQDHSTKTGERVVRFQPKDDTVIGCRRVREKVGLTKALIPCVHGGWAHHSHGERWWTK